MSLVAEFRTAEQMLHALRVLRERGYRELDAFTPYPVKGLDQVLGLERSRINWYVLPFTLLGSGVAYLVQWWCNAHDYPLDVGGRPLNSAPAWVPITFEMGVLATALAGVVLMLAFSGLPELYNPVFEVNGFERASIDRFWIAVGELDPAFDEERTGRELEALGALFVARPRGRA